MLSGLFWNAYLALVYTWKAKRLRRHAAKWLMQSLQTEDEGKRMAREFPNYPDGLRLLEDAKYLRAYAHRVRENANIAESLADRYRTLFWSLWAACAEMIADGASEASKKSRGKYHGN